MRVLNLSLLKNTSPPSFRTAAGRTNLSYLKEALGVTRFDLLKHYHLGSLFCQACFVRPIVWQDFLWGCQNGASSLLGIIWSDSYRFIQWSQRQKRKGTFSGDCIEDSSNMESLFQAS